MIHQIRIAPNPSEAQNLLDEVLKSTRGRAGLTGFGQSIAKRTHTYNSRLAQELRKWADAQLGVEAVHGALYCAYFIDNINVGDVEEMLMIVAALDLDGEGARHVLESHNFSDTIEDDWPYPGIIL